LVQAPQVTVVGSSFVGLTTALALAQHGIRCRLLDTDARKVEMILAGRAPFEEPGVHAALRRHLKSGRITATASVEDGYRGATHVMVCVGTPQARDGSQDLRSVKAVARSIGQEVRRRKRSDWLTVIVKSTVVPGTTVGLVREEVEKASGRKAGRDFGLASNPEFLKEGTALKDALRPDRVVVGGLDKRSTDETMRLFKWVKAPVVRTDPTTAETVKYAANAFLATKVSLANEFANYCAEVGVDWYTVADAIGHDDRIGRKFLNAGVGFGGSCFPKDLKAITTAARGAGRSLEIVQAALDINGRQPSEVTRVLLRELGGLERKRIAVLGLAFKSGTDDVRESRALLIVAEVLEGGAEVVGYDPLVKGQFEKALALHHRANFTRVDRVEDALEGVDAVLIQTEADEFRALKPAAVKRRARRALVLDGRRVLDPQAFARAGVDYWGVGIGMVRASPARGKK
jgi:UDPglucose 6-dehydrogenase